MAINELGLSVVVSSYNYGRYLRAAIDSALEQRCEPLQVIVVDDGSTDDSVEIIKSYGDRIETIFQKNEGQVASCNAGLQRCRHGIVIFLDSDDRLEPFAAEEIMALWTPATVKVQYVQQAIDSEGALVNTIFPKYPHGLTPETIKAELLRASVYPATTTSGTAFSRQFLLEVMPIPASYGCHIDDALNVMAPLYGDVQTLRKTLGQYRVHDRNVTAHSELSVERFMSYAHEYKERARYLADNCERLGYDLPNNVIENDLAYWECLLAAAVLKPDRRLPLLWPALRASFSSILDPGQRVTHAVWASVLAIAPRPLARHMLAQRFIFNRRSRLAELFLQGIWRLGHLTKMLSAKPGPSKADDRPSTESMVSLSATGQYPAER